MRRVRSTARFAAGVLLLAAIYYGAGQGSLALQYEGPVAALWLPSGVGAAVLYRRGLRWWPGLVLGDLALMDTSQPLGTALGITAGNLADMVVMAVALRSLLSSRATLDRLDEVGAVLVAILAGATITASVAVLCVSAGGVVAASGLLAFWRSWLLADACGSLVIIPLALVWTQPCSRAVPRRAVWEGALVAAVVVALSVVSLSAALPLTYMVFPALIWAALRLAQRGATLALAVAATMTVAITAAELGAFVEHSISDRALSTQLYIAVAAVTTLVLAAIDSERRRAWKAVAASRARIVAAGAHERRRLELELQDTALSRVFALLVRMSLLQERLPASPHAIAAALGELIGEAEMLGHELRRFAHGIAPPLLASGGVASALAPECADGPIPVRLLADEIGLSTPAAELAVYRCCRAAIQHAAEHGGPNTSATVRLQQHERVLMFSVDTDAGGDDPPTDFRATATALRDGIESVGGRLEIVNAPGRGISVAGIVPWPSRAPDIAHPAAPSTRGTYELA